MFPSSVRTGGSKRSRKYRQRKLLRVKSAEDKSHWSECGGRKGGEGIKDKRRKKLTMKARCASSPEWMLYFEY